MIELTPGYDKPSGVRDQLRWLGDAGFSACGVMWSSRDLASSSPTWTPRHPLRLCGRRVGDVTSVCRLGAGGPNWRRRSRNWPDDACAATGSGARTRRARLERALEPDISAREPAAPIPSLIGLLSRFAAPGTGKPPGSPTPARGIHRSQLLTAGLCPTRDRVATGTDACTRSTATSTVRTRDVRAPRARDGSGASPRWIWTAESRQAGLLWGSSSRRTPRPR